jgi:hypothetical protein
MRHALWAAVSGLAASSAMAGAQALIADQDFAETSAFSLNFAFLPASPSDISFTQFDVEVDPLSGTAVFVDYYQEVAALTLPSPDGQGVLSTGPLVIEIVPGSSQGTFDPVTREFQTFDLYAIHFTGDLSAFGLSSPVILPGDSLGKILNADANLAAGDIALDWDGEGFLPNPGDPTQPIPFTYTCSTKTNFEAGARCNSVCPGDVNRNCEVGLEDLTVLLANFGEAADYTTPRRGDQTNDQAVDLDDLLTVLGNIGAGCN